jgi:hypothetical protein
MRVRPSCFISKVYWMRANPFQSPPLSNSCTASAAIAAGPGRSWTLTSASLEIRPRESTLRCRSGFSARWMRTLEGRVRRGRGFLREQRWMRCENRHEQLPNRRPRIGQIWPYFSGRSRFTVTSGHSRMENEHDHACQYHAPRPGYPQR